MESDFKYSLLMSELRGIVEIVYSSNAKAAKRLSTKFGIDIRLEICVKSCQLFKDSSLNKKSRLKFYLAWQALVCRPLASPRRSLRPTHL